MREYAGKAFISFGNVYNTWMLLQWGFFTRGHYVKCVTFYFFIVLDGSCYPPPYDGVVGELLPIVLYINMNVLTHSLGDATINAAIDILIWPLMKI